MGEELQRLREDLAAIGCSCGEIADAQRLFEAGSFDELARHLRKCRCDLMEQMHECGKRIDRVDYLIRQTKQIAK